MKKVSGILAVSMICALTLGACATDNKSGVSSSSSADTMSGSDNRAEDNFNRSVRK